jgi:acetoin utilization deacetylase AcuC-like enzyme
MLPFKLVYSNQYELNLGKHVFPAQKYRLLHDRLLTDRIAEPGDFVEPEPASEEDLLLVHDRAWIDKLKHGTLSVSERLKLEIPYSLEMVAAFQLMSGGTVLAARHAVGGGLGFNLGGGFHHGFRSHGEGFCAVNDVAIAARRMQHDGLVERVMVVDTDVHHGNGTASIFADDPTVFTLSIHHFDNYPTEKPASDVDIHLENAVSDDEYLSRLERALLPSIEKFQPNLILYVSGADPFMEDQLGGLNLTFDGLIRRDRLVFGAARSRKIPVCAVLAGGYAVNTADTVSIHANTVKTAAEAA